MLGDPEDTNALTKYARKVTNPHGQFGTLLTVDSFEGYFLWHATITFLSVRLSAIEWNNLKTPQREAVRILARELLLGVGHSDSDVETTHDKCYHLLRKLTIEEEKQLD